jgi:hypothetical protein
MISGMKERYGNIRLPQKFVLLVDDDIRNNSEDKDDERDDGDLEAGTICTFFHSDKFI